MIRLHTVLNQLRSLTVSTTAARSELLDDACAHASLYVATERRRQQGRWWSTRQPNTSEMIRDAPKCANTYNSNHTTTTILNSTAGMVGWCTTRVHTGPGRTAALASEPYSLRTTTWLREYDSFISEKFSSSPTWFVPNMGPFSLYQCSIPFCSNTY